MNENLVWLRQQHEQLHDELQRERLFLQDHLDRRKEASGVWNDACSLEIDNRYMDPLKEEASSCLSRLKEQHEAHLSTAASLEMTSVSFDAATRQSNLLCQHLDETSSVFRQLETTLNHALSEVESSAAKIRECDDLLAQASAIVG